MKKKLLGLISGTMIAATVIAPIASTTTVQAAQRGWVYNSAQKAYNYYDSNGKKYTGWHYMTKKEGEKKDHWNYFSSDGRLYTGWKYMSKAEGEKKPHWSYFGANGWLRTGWVQLGKGTSEPDGNSAKHWSYFGGNGWLRTGWVQLGKGTSEPDGNSAKHWSYFGSNGWLRTGWVQLGKGTSEPDGNSAKHYSYFGTNGWLRTGMQEMSTAANPDGGAAKHKSYFGDNGWLVVNRDFTYKSKDYQADSKGWVTERKAVQSNLMKVTFMDGLGNTLSTQWVEKGKNATPPKSPTRAGYVFDGWDRSYNNITSYTTILAKWVKSGQAGETKKQTYKVTFTDGNGKTLKTQTVEKGKAATAPANPKRDGYTFIGWDKDFNNVANNITVNAKWEKNHQHNWQPVYKTIHHEAITHKEEKRTPQKSFFNQTNAIQIYGSIGTVTPAFYQVIEDDLTAIGLDFNDLYGIYDKVPAFKLILEDLNSDLDFYSNAFWQLYTADDALYKKCLDYLGNEEKTLDYLYSSRKDIVSLTNSIKIKLKKLLNIELGELTKIGKEACTYLYNKIDTMTVRYNKIYNKGFPDPDKDGKRGHAEADRKKYNQHSLYFDDVEFGKYLGYIVHLSNWRQTSIEKPGWYNSVLVEEITVIDKPAWDEKVIDYYKCNCGQTKTK